MLRYKLREGSLTFSSTGEVLAIAPGTPVIGGTRYCLHTFQWVRKGFVPYSSGYCCQYSGQVSALLWKSQAHTCVTSVLYVCYGNEGSITLASTSDVGMWDKATECRVRPPKEQPVCSSLHGPCICSSPASRPHTRFWKGQCQYRL